MHRIKGCISLHDNTHYAIEILKQAVKLNAVLLQSIYFVFFLQRSKTKKNHPLNRIYICVCMKNQVVLFYIPINLNQQLGYSD